MFCKHCGRQIESANCPWCGTMSELRAYSNDLDRIMTKSHPENVDNQVYEEGFKKGYQKGLNDGYKNGYNEGVKTAAIRSEETTSVVIHPRKRNVVAICFIISLLGIVLSGVFFCNMGYKNGYSAGRDNGQKETANKHFVILEEKYNEGFEDGKTLGYEQAGCIPFPQGKRHPAYLPHR